jgi:hypothetical protein
MTPTYDSYSVFGQASYFPVDFSVIFNQYELCSILRNTGQSTKEGYLPLLEQSQDSKERLAFLKIEVVL